jgi:hypothetical protein
VVCVAALALWPGVARAQQSPVVRLLLTAPDARTRAQAAMTLGRLRPTDARAALETALGDPVALVRVAAASTLGALRDPVAVPALRARLQDADANVREAVSLALRRLPADATDAPASNEPEGAPLATARFLLAPGDLHDHTGTHPEHLPLLTDAMLRTLAGRPGLALQRTIELPPAATARVRRGLLRPFSLEGGLQRLDAEGPDDNLAVRAEVQFAIVAMPQRAIVGMVTGAATARGPGFSPTSRRRLESVAVEGAVRGALRDIEQSLGQARR